MMREIFFTIDLTPLIPLSDPPFLSEEGGTEMPAEVGTQWSDLFCEFFHLKERYGLKYFPLALAEYLCYTGEMRLFRRPCGPINNVCFHYTGKSTHAPFFAFND
jgi:hypothetical protein